MELVARKWTIHSLAHPVEGEDDFPTEVEVRPRCSQWLCNWSPPKAADATTDQTDATDRSRPSIRKENAARKVPKSVRRGLPNRRGLLA
jgi:hypothetical protein